MAGTSEDKWGISRECTGRTGQQDSRSHRYTNAMSPGDGINNLEHAQLERLEGD
jgi:hypothetical protein